jgi:hypothetical protein
MAMWLVGYKQYAFAIVEFVCGVYSQLPID